MEDERSILDTYDEMAHRVAALMRQQVQQLKSEADIKNVVAPPAAQSQKQALDNHTKQAEAWRTRVCKESSQNHSEVLERQLEELRAEMAFKDEQLQQSQERCASLVQTNSRLLQRLKELHIHEVVLQRHYETHSQQQELKWRALLSQRQDKARVESDEEGCFISPSWRESAVNAAFHSLDSSSQQRKTSSCHLDHLDDQAHDNDADHQESSPASLNSQKDE